MAKTIFVVDRDLGFVFWLGRALDDAGFNAFPARCAEDAAQLQELLQVTVDLLVVNRETPDISQLVQHLRRANEQLRILKIAENEVEAESPEEGFVHAKPKRPDTLARMEWVNAVSRTLTGAPHQQTLLH